MAERLRQRLTAPPCPAPRPTTCRTGRSHTPEGAPSRDDDRHATHHAALRLLGPHRPGHPRRALLLRPRSPEDCHDDVIAEASRSTGPARFYRLPPGEKRDILAQAIARLYPTEGS